MKLQKGQCGVVRGGRRMCVLPNIGARFVSKDFDAAAEGFEEVTTPEQPKMVLAAEAGVAGALEDMDNVDELEQHLGSDVFVQAVAAGVANAIRGVLDQSRDEASTPELEVAQAAASESQHSERSRYA